MDKLRIQLRLVFYCESDLWFAHCLEMDLVGHGDSKAKAFKMLNEAIELQIKMSVAAKNATNIFQPADAKFFEMYAAGKDCAAGVLSVEMKPPKKCPDADRVVIEDYEAREYKNHLAAC